MPRTKTIGGFCKLKTPLLPSSEEFNFDNYMYVNAKGVCFKTNDIYYPCFTRPPNSTKLTFRSDKVMTSKHFLVMASLFV